MRDDPHPTLQADAEGVDPKVKLWATPDGNSFNSRNRKGHPGVAARDKAAKIGKVRLRKIDPEHKTVGLVL